MSEIFLKILLVGDSFVGKTSLLLKYTENIFSEVHIATIGVEFKEKIINHNNRTVRLQIWDTSGQERFRSITQNFYRNADGILFVFDVTNKDSFTHIKDWLIDSEILDADVSKIIIGNKIDLQEIREISKERMEEFGKNKKMDVYESSAKTGSNVDDIFRKLVELILANKTEEEINELYCKNQQNVSISSEESGKSKNKKKCC